jgi:hypothetical protein
MAARPPRKPPVRSTTANIYVRCRPAEKDALERAAAMSVADVPGARMPVYTWLLQAGLEKARSMGIVLEIDADIERRGKGGR